MSNRKTTILKFLGLSSDRTSTTKIPLPVAIISRASGGLVGYIVTQSFLGAIVGACVVGVFIDAAFAAVRKR